VGQASHRVALPSLCPIDQSTPTSCYVLRFAGGRLARRRRRVVIRAYLNEGGRLRGSDGVPERLDGVVWIDMLRPTSEEEAEVESRLGLNVPTRDEMAEIEISSRLYYEEGVSFMTAILPAQTDGDQPEMAPVTFVLTNDRLLTIRYHEPRAFQALPARAEKHVLGCNTGEAVLIVLLEAIVDRMADILERAGADIDAISRTIFRRNGPEPNRNRDFQQVLESIGRKGELISNFLDSVVTLERLIGFLSQATTQRRSDKDVRTRVKTLARDTHSLTGHASFLSQKITFLLDATLGMVNIEQNAIIKIFSVAAVVFLPPTLVASIYGMNFRHIPEFGWRFGYPFALLLMVASALLPYWYFKRRGWL
jgi:magnesium transporter